MTRTRTRCVIRNTQGVWNGGRSIYERNNLESLKGLNLHSSERTTRGLYAYMGRKLSVPKNRRSLWSLKVSLKKGGFRSLRWSTLQSSKVGLFVEPKKEFDLRLCCVYLRKHPQGGCPFVSTWWSRTVNTERDRHFREWCFMVWIFINLLHLLVTPRNYEREGRPEVGELNQGVWCLPLVGWLYRVRECLGGTLVYKWVHSFFGSSSVLSDSSVRTQDRVRQSFIEDNVKYTESCSIALLSLLL